MSHVHHNATHRKETGTKHTMIIIMPYYYIVLCTRSIINPQRMRTGEGRSVYTYTRVSPKQSVGGAALHSSYCGIGISEFVVTSNT